MRRAAAHLKTISSGEKSDPVHCQQVLLSAASRSELHFIRLYKGSVQSEIIDLAYAVLGEQRPATGEGETR